MRNYKRKSGKGLSNEDHMKRAVEEVIAGASENSTAKQYGLSRETLRRYVKKTRQGEVNSYKADYAHRKVFNEETEQLLAQYLSTASGMFFGLTTVQFRRLAYEFGSKNGIKLPDAWEKNKMAGADWLTSFLKRNDRLSIRRPEATSIARATAFNRPNINAFFDKLHKVIEENGLSGSSIWNLDESGCSTVHNVPRVIAEKGKKQVGQVTSRERGELVTVCSIVSAAGVALPPAYVFPRKNMRDAFMTGALEGSVGLTHESGWMTSLNFVKVLEHFIKYSHASMTNKQLLVMDNHDSHLSVEGLELAKASGVIVLTLPPHTSNKTQPLDRTVFGPFKTYYGNSCNSWMMSNPGKPLSIYQVAELAGNAWERAVTPTNIKAGFRVAGIWPYDRDVFADADFLPSTVTDRADPNEAQTRLQQSDDNVEARDNQPERIMISPEQLHPFPKAPPRKESQKGRKRGRSIIATSTPELKRLKEEKQKKNSAAAKKEKICDKSSRKGPKRKLTLGELEEMEEEEAEKEPMRLDDDDDVDSFDEFTNETDTEHIPDFADPTDVEIGDYVLARFSTGTSASCRDLYYVGCVSEVSGNNLEAVVNFYRRKGNVFVKPQVEDVMTIPMYDIVAKFPMPTIQKGTARTQSRLSFGELSFHMYNVE